MAEATAHIPRDVIADDGTAIRRGYLEIILDGLDVVPDDPSATTTSVTVALLDQKSRRESMIDFRQYPSQIPIKMERADRRRVIVALMDRLTNTLQVSGFTDDLEDFDSALTRFGKFLEESTVDALAKTSR